MPFISNSFTRLNQQHRRASTLQSLLHSSTRAGFSSCWGKDFTKSVVGAWVKLQEEKLWSAGAAPPAGSLLQGAVVTAVWVPAGKWIISGRIPCINPQSSTCSLAEPWSHTE